MSNDAIESSGFQEELKQLERATGSGLGATFLNLDGDADMLVELAGSFLDKSNETWLHIRDLVAGENYSEALQKVERFESSARNLSLAPLLHASKSFRHELEMPSGNTFCACLSMIERVEAVNRTIRRFLHVLR